MPFSLATYDWIPLQRPSISPLADLQEELTSKELVILEEDKSIAKESLDMALFKRGPYIRVLAEEEEAWEPLPLILK